jgi:AcrR family transcriptional regulator
MTVDASRHRRLSASERRDLILQGAMQVFAERGYHDASMVEIARAAGITAAVIYDHFPSKRDLHKELIETHAEALLMAVGAAVGQAGEESAERMRTGIAAFFEFVETHPFAWRLIFRDPPSDPVIATTWYAASQRATQAIAIFIGYSAPATLVGEGNREQRLEMYGELLKSSLNGLAAWWYEHRDVPRDEVVERVMEFCWIGLDQLAIASNEEGS